MSILEKEKEAMLISELFKGNLIELYTLLRNFKINPSVLKDLKGNSPLQICCLNNNFQVAEFLLRYVEEYYPSVSIQSWVNERNIDGLTSVHFAIFRGNSVIFI